MKIDELRPKTISEIKAELIELRKEQFKLRMQIVTGQSSNTASLKQTRKDVAIAKTILNQKIKEVNNG